MNRPDAWNEWSERVLINYVRDLADKMGLKDWQFSLAQGTEDGLIARTNVWGSDSRIATLEIMPVFWKYGPRTQRETIVHELLHWHTDKLFQTAKDVFSNQLGIEAYRIATASLERMHELAVDGIAAAWARQMPLIDWTDQRPVYSGYEKDIDGNSMD